MNYLMLATPPFISRGPKAILAWRAFWTPLNITILTACIILFYVLLIIAWWKLFTKAGEKGWKSIIPFYNFYTQCKLTWSRKFFWILIGIAIVTGIFNHVYMTYDMIPTPVGLTVLAILGVAAGVLSIISLYRLSKAYGHGVGYTVGLVFLNFIFMLILGLGSSKYQGNVYKKSKGK